MCVCGEYVKSMDGWPFTLRRARGGLYHLKPEGSGRKVFVLTAVIDLNQSWKFQLTLLRLRRILVHETVVRP